MAMLARKWVYLLVALGLILSITACAPTLTPQQAIVGKWVNAKGYSIEFYADGTGFIPGIDGQIPPYKFSYSFKDPTHLELDLAGQPGTAIQIKLDGDQMTWLSQNGDAAFVYQRAK